MAHKRVLDKKQVEKLKKEGKELKEFQVERIDGMIEKFKGVLGFIQELKEQIKDMPDPFAPLEMPGDLKRELNQVDERIR